MSYANRGMVSENIIEKACEQYKKRNLAVITKVPTPVVVLRLRGSRIVDGFYEKRGTIDFEGTLKGGRSLAFDSKETRGKNLPLKNIHEHQIDYLQSVSKMNGVAFILVCFTQLNKYYRLSIKDLVGYIEAPWSSNKKSIPIQFFEAYAKEVKSENGLYLNFLKDL